MTTCKVPGCPTPVPSGDFVCPRHRRELNQRERAQIAKLNSAIFFAIEHGLSQWTLKYTWARMADAAKAHPDDYQARWEFLDHCFRSQCEAWWPEDVNNVP